jgi:hypothetical protein
MQSLLRVKEVAVNDYIKVKVPTVGEILDYGEREYYGLLMSFISTPYEMMAQLHLAGYDYEEITEFELFVNMLLGAANNKTDTSIVFGDLDLSSFLPAKSKENGDIVLLDAQNDRVIDENIHYLICEIIRKLLFSEKPKQRAGNKEAKEYLVRRAVEKYNRNKNKPYVSFLEDLIIALVNTEQFKYDYEQTMNLSLYRFNASVRQIPRKVNYDHLMSGVYAGTIKYSELNPRDLNWLSQT